MNKQVTDRQVELRPFRFLGPWGKGVWILIAAVACGALAVTVARHQVSQGGGGKVFGLGETRFAALEGRLAGMERRQQEQFNQLQAELRRWVPAPDDVAVSRHAQDERRQRQQHAQRMETDPSYALAEQRKELEALRSNFAKDAVNPKWASETRAHLDDAIVLAAAVSGVQLKAGNIDCRSTSCMIKLDVDAVSSYEDLVTPLMVDLAEVLPHARLVVFPAKNGVREVNILANAAVPDDSFP